MKPRLLILATVLASAAGGCTTVDPGGAFDDTRRRVAGRHPGEVAWMRGEASRAAADQRLDELLASPLDPDAAAEVALLANPSLQATLEELGIAQADLAQAARLANPGISFARLTGSGERQQTIAVTADLVDWLVQPLRRRVAEAELERTKLEVGHAILETAAAARLALVAYQAAEQLAAGLERAAELDRAAADYAAALHQAGNLTALDLAAIRAEWAETRAALGRARVEVVLLRESAGLAMGLAASGRWSAGDGLPAVEARAPGDAAALEEVALAERLDLEASRWAVTTLEKALRMGRRTRFSPLGVEVGVERERETDGVTLTGPVVELRLPLFDTGKASVARLEAELARSRWQLAGLEAAVRSRVRQLSAELAASRELVDLYRDTVLPLRREVVERTLGEYNQMLVGTFELLAAKQAEVTAERSATEALAGYWQTRYELEQVLGRPLPQDAAPSESAPAPHHQHEAPPDPAAEPPTDHHDHDPPASGEEASR